jgi:hypothetical protein
LTLKGRGNKWNKRKKMIEREKTEREREKQKSFDGGNECTKENGLRHVRLAYSELSLACSFSLSLSFSSVLLSVLFFFSILFFYSLF